MPEKQHTTKPKTRLVRMKLERELLASLNEMRGPCKRTLPNMIECCLRWAAWAHSKGRGPDREMMGKGKPGYHNWNRKLRAQREVRELEKLFRLDNPKGKA